MFKSRRAVCCLDADVTTESVQYLKPEQVMSETHPSLSPDLQFKTRPPGFSFYTSSILWLDAHRERKQMDTQPLSLIKPPTLC